MLHEQADEVRAGVDRIADAIEVHHAAVGRPVRAGAHGAAEAGVHAGQAHGRHARGHERRHQIGVGRSAEHGHDRVERVGVSDAEAVDLARRDVPAGEFGVDGAAAAMDDHERAGGDDGLAEGADPRTLGGRLEQLTTQFQHEGSHQVRTVH